MTSQGKIDSVTTQLHKLETGESDIIECPYCGVVVARGETLCCLTLGKAARAWMQRRAMQKTAETTERVMEALERMDTGMLVN